MNLSGYSPDFEAGETAFGTGERRSGWKSVLEKRGEGAEEGRLILGRTGSRKEAVKRRCLTALQARPEALLGVARPNSRFQEKGRIKLAKERGW